MIKKILEKESFEPSVMGLFINPFFIARRGLLKGIKKYSSLLSGKILDVGCGTKPYEHYFKGTEYVGLEIDTTINKAVKKADFFYDGSVFPFKDNEFDSLITNQVLEHVFNPNEFLKEINRVLKPGGKFLVTVPFVWDEHEQPYDYARYSSFGIRFLLEKHGFKVIDQYKCNADFSIIGQLINAYLYKIVRPIPLLKQLTTLLVMPFFSIGGIILGKIFPGNPDLYLDNILLAEKLSDIK